MTLEKLEEFFRFLDEWKQDAWREWCKEQEGLGEAEHKQDANV